LLHSPQPLRMTQVTKYIGSEMWSRPIPAAESSLGLVAVGRVKHSCSDNKWLLADREYNPGLLILYFLKQRSKSKASDRDATFAANKFIRGHIDRSSHAPSPNTPFFRCPYFGILPRTGPGATKWKYSAADNDGDVVKMQHATKAHFSSPTQTARHEISWRADTDTI
jgi:hypothetical protein